MAELKEITTELMEYLEAHSLVNEVTLGDGSEVDLSTHTNFPLVHVIPLSIDYTGAIATHNYQILVLTTFKPNTQDRLDSLTLAANIMSDFENALQQGAVFSFAAEVTPDNSAEIMYDQYANRLYGYAVSLGILTARYSSC